MSDRPREEFFHAHHPPYCDREPVGDGLFRAGIRRRQADDPGLGAGPELSVLRPHDEGVQGRRRRSRASPSIESDGQVSSPKQTADIEAAITKGVKGIVLSPNEVDAMAPALQEAVDAKMPVVTVDRRVA